MNVQNLSQTKQTRCALKYNQQVAQEPGNYGSQVSNSDDYDLTDGNICPRANCVGSYGHYPLTGSGDDDLFTADWYCNGYAPRAYDAVTAYQIAYDIALHKKGVVKGLRMKNNLQVPTQKCKIVKTVASCKDIDNNDAESTTCYSNPNDLIEDDADKIKAKIDANDNCKTLCARERA